MGDLPTPAIEFSCAACGRKARLPDLAVGKMIVCPGCGLRCCVPGPRRTTRVPLTPPLASGISATLLRKPIDSSSALPLARQERHALLPLLILAVAGSVILAIFAFVLAVTPREAREPPLRVPSASRPDNLTADTVSTPADPPPPSPPPAADRSIRVVKLDGWSEAALRDVLQPLARQLTAMNADSADDLATERRAALLRLRMYRLVCGLKDDDLVLDDQLNEEAGAAAKVCHRLGYLSHEPPNPGLPDAEFAQARRGAGSGNLASGMRDLTAAVNGWMDDSDADNVAALGHRRWCLNPPLRRIGFGRSDRYFAMWAHDSSGSGRIPQPAICFPPPGCVPIDMFRPHYAWSVTLDPSVFQKPTARLAKIKIRKQGTFSGSATATDLDFVHIDTGGYGIANCIIFRPVLPSTAVGSGYEITLDGILDHDGRNVRIIFATRFIDSMPMPGPGVRH